MLFIIPLYLLFLKFIDYILQAAGRSDIPFKLLSIGLLIKITFNYMLVSIPEVNIEGANIGTLVCYIFICIMLLYFINKVIGVLPNLFSTFLKPLSCGICCAVSAYLSYNLFSQIMMYKIATLLAILIAVLVYLATLFLTKTITNNDLKKFSIKGNFFKLFRK